MDFFLNTFSGATSRLVTQKSKVIVNIKLVFIKKKKTKTIAFDGPMSSIVTNQRKRSV